MSGSFRISLPALALFVAFGASAALIGATVADSAASLAAKPPSRRLRWLAGTLGLSADQLQHVRAIFAADAGARARLRVQLRRADARGDASDGSSDPAVVASASRRLFALRAKELREVAAVLTPDQRAALAEIRARDRRRRANERSDALPSPAGSAAAAGATS